MVPLSYLGDRSVSYERFNRSPQLTGDYFDAIAMNNKYNCFKTILLELVLREVQRSTV